ncbi:MAG: glyoxalase [Pseudonocardiaceae bacterium]|nr:glyoxalase [Pseudonocardiaceae bacterium]
MIDPLDSLRAPVMPIEPDPRFATQLRARLEHAVLQPEGVAMTTTVDAPAHTIGCYIAVDDARRALEFYVEAFDARRRGEPYIMADGRIGHAELAVGDSVLMLADEFPEIDMLSPRTRGGPSQSLYLRVPDVDATVQRAVDAGARLERAVADYDYGRNGIVVDPSGHRWMVASSLPPPPSRRHGEVGYLTYAVPDAERAKAFYDAVLGWRFTPGRVENGWQIDGTAPMSGMWGGATEPRIQPLFHVDDLDAALAAVRAHGGRAGEPEQQPYGLSAECTDDQGARFWLLQS